MYRMIVVLPMPLRWWCSMTGEVMLRSCGRGVAVDGLRLGERLEAELAVEAVLAGAVPLEGLAAVPDAPEVGVAAVGVVEVRALAVGRVRAAGQ